MKIKKEMFLKLFFDLFVFHCFVPGYSFSLIFIYSLNLEVL